MDVEKILTNKDIVSLLNAPPTKTANCDGCNVFDHLYADPASNGFFEFCVCCWQGQLDKKIKPQRKRPR